MIAIPHKYKVNEVFTPRNREVNKNIYINRPKLETELVEAINGTLHVLVYGDSGSGKSWLCKKVLDDLNAYYVSVNCANASRFKSLTDAISHVSIPTGTASQSGYSEGKEGELSVFQTLKSKITHNKFFEIKKDEPLLAAFKKIRDNAKNRTAVLIIDNLESIFQQPEMMVELADIITLLDDPKYAKYKVKLLIVGVPSGVIEYFSKIKNLPTFANRIQEISEVSNLSESQVNNLVKRGFLDLLEAKIEPELFAVWQRHIYSVTLGVAQRIHEYCEKLAYLLINNDGIGTENLLYQADLAWLKIGFRKSFGVIGDLMNERATKTNRRNQVLFALSKISRRTFTPSQVEEVIRKEFENSTKDVILAIGQIMASDLSGNDRSIIRRTSTKATEYEFMDPRYLMCLRMVLKKENETVIKLDVQFDDSEDVT